MCRPKKTARWGPGMCRNLLQFACDAVHSYVQCNTAYLSRVNQAQVQAITTRLIHEESRAQNSRERYRTVTTIPMPPLISLEDHFISKAFQSSESAATLAFHLFPPTVLENLLDLTEQRISALDTAGIAVQVVSHSPATESPGMCRWSNEQLHRGIQKANGRLAGFAMLPMADSDAAVEELTHCVKNLGFVGTLVPNHARGTYYDGDEYLQPFAKAVELDVPIYLHPTPPTPAKRQEFIGNYSEEVTTVLSCQGWNWHADVAVHLLRLYAAGIFDKLPKLRIIIGHMGEMLPMMVDRIQARLGHIWKERQRTFIEVWRQNVWITISGMPYLGPFLALLKSTTPDKILFSVDYPFEDNVELANFMHVLRSSGVVNEEELEGIMYRNAESLLKVKCRSDLGF